MVERLRPAFGRLVASRARGASRRDALEIVVKHERQAGIPGAVIAHSLRAGFVTEVPIPKIMDKTGPTTLASIRAYNRPKRAQASDPTARLLEGA